MRILCLVVFAASLLQCSEAALSLRGMTGSLSKIGGNFARRGGEWIDDLDNVASLAGYNFAALGTYWRSNTLAGFAQMKRSEMQEAMETFNLAVSTLAVWDLGQGIAYPIADKLINKVILKYQDDFQRTLQAFGEYRNVMKTDVLDDATKVADSDILKGRLLDAKTDISKSFQLDVESGLSRFKNTQIYGDLVTDLKGIKTWAKAAKWADVFAGPLFDAATVAVSAWQLAEAIKNNDPFAIASSSLGLASGLAGLTGFAVAALATAGSTLAAVAGPVGAVIGAILGIASILVEIIGSLNPYTKIDRDITMLNELRDASKKFLDADFQNLQKLVPSQANFSFSWVYELNQGHLIDLITGRASEHQEPVVFRLDPSGKQENGYMVIGEKKKFDKSKYPGNFFWNPQGIVDLGYDFYGKKVTEELKGVTVIGSTELVSGKPDVKLRGMDIVTYENPEDDLPDSVIIDDMYDIALWNNVEVKTGGGNDVICINGLIGKPGHRDYPGHKEYRWGYSMKIRIKTAADDTPSAKSRESNVLSFEGMSAKHTHDYGISGVHYEMRGGSLYYISDKEGSSKKYLFGEIDGIKMFIGTPFNDIARFSMDHDYVVRQTKGSNEYILVTTSWGPFAITIDDQCEEPGPLKITKGHTFAGEVKMTDLIYLPGTKTMFIYGRQRNQRWQVRGKIFFNRRREGHPMITTEADGKSRRLDELPEVFEAKEGSDYLFSGQSYQYYFDRDIGGGCGEFKIFLNVPEFQRGRYEMNFHSRKNTLDELILTEDLVSKCLKKANRVMQLIQVDTIREIWMLKLLAPNGLDNNDCPAKDFEVRMSYGRFERLLEKMEGDKQRLVVDLRTDIRDKIDIGREMKKLDEKQQFHFDKDIKGKEGVPQAVELAVPAETDPVSVVKHAINLKGGEKANEDWLVFTEDFRTWLKVNQRKIKLVKGKKGLWNLRLERGNGKATHRVRLRNIETIVYDTKDGLLRVFVVPNLATSTEDIIDLEQQTATKEARARRRQWPDWANDCKIKGEEKRK